MFFYIILHNVDSVVGTHLFVGGAVTVVVVGGLTQQRVEATSHGHIVAVQAVGAVE